MALAIDHVSKGNGEDKLFSLLFQLGNNEAEIQEAFGQNQISQSVIAKNQADATEEESKESTEKLNRMMQEQNSSSVGSIIFKVFSVIVAALFSSMTGGALSALLVTAVAAVMASPVGEKAVSELGTALTKAMGKTDLAKVFGPILAQAIIVAIVTVATAGTETSSALLSSADEGAAAFSFAATKINFVQSIFSTNLVGTAITDVVKQIPGLSDTAKEAIATVATLIAMVAIGYGMMAAGAEEGQSLVKQVEGKLSEFLGKPVAFEQGLSYFGMGAGLASAGASATVGSYQIALGGNQEALGQLEGNLSFGAEFVRTLTSLTNTAQKTYQSLMESDRTIFNTDFSAVWRACAQAELQG